MGEDSSQHLATTHIFQNVGARIKEMVIQRSQKKAFRLEPGADIFELLTGLHHSSGSVHPYLPTQHFMLLSSHVSFDLLSPFQGVVKLE